MKKYMVNNFRGPCFATQGIHKPIYIMTFDDARITDVAPQVFLKQYTSKDTGNFEVKIKVIALAAKAYTAKVSFSVASLADYSETVNFVAGENEFQVSLACYGAKMWFPHGYGSQTMYVLRVSIFDATSNAPITYTTRIGFKNVKVVQTPVSTGDLFYFEVNGLAIFSKGANYIPPDAFADRMTPDLYKQIVISAVDVNMNTLRVWGGGQYAPDVSGILLK